MKQAEEAKRTAIESARRAFEDYQPLKHEVDLMRTELLGLEKLPELPEEEKEKLGGLGYVTNVYLSPVTNGSGRNRTYFVNDVYQGPT